MKVVKVLGYAVVGLLAVVTVTATSVYFVSKSKLDQQFTVSVRPITIPTDAESRARGEHMARTRGCVDCHGADFAGHKVVEDGAMGRIYGANLTPGKGSRTSTFRDEDWVRAIRHGVGPDHRGLVFMPADEYSKLSDEDLGCIIAFMKSVPAVDRERVPISAGPVARTLLTVGKFKLAAAVVDHEHVMPPAVTKTASAEYGHYLANGCVGCHGPNLSGGKIEIGPPDWPPARNLTPHSTSNLSRWTEAEFIQTLREAHRPDGTELNPVMPRAFGGMDDTELKALYAYLKSLPPVATGVR